jgi:hypothetical protein
MAERYLSAGLVAGVIVWLGVLVLAPNPREAAAQEAKVDCAVICMDTQPITLPVYPPATDPIGVNPRSWPDQTPI